jgi:transcriptional regulator with XRE-family HTH domain
MVTARPLGEQLRQRRLALGLSLSKAAAQVNASPGTFDSWERFSIARPQRCDWEAIAAFLGYDPRLVSVS